MKVIAKKTFKQLEEIFKAGDVLDFEVIRYEVDTLIHKEIWRWHYPTKSKGAVLSEIGEPFKYKFCDALYAKAGSYKDYRIITSDGRSYTGKTISNFIGPIPLERIFDKV